ncbi:hypothetical protein JCM13991_06850 [Thermodesulfovibrio hydrogeniphilus]
MPILIGREKINANIDIITVPINMGAIPYKSILGFHALKRKAKKSPFLKIGIPKTKRKKNIINTTITLKKVETNKILLTNFSIIWLESSHVL